jgi:lipoprotein-anchoring transpeptidase ErfK/SrfK
MLPLRGDPIAKASMSIMIHRNAGRFPGLILVLAAATACARSQQPSGAVEPEPAPEVAREAPRPSTTPAPTSAPARAAPAPIPLTLAANLSARTLAVQRGGSAIATYQVAIGDPRHRTPTGTYRIRKIVWNPRWVPPKSPWARGKTPKPPGHPENPMKVVKIFFKEPTYYIHGTGDLRSLGDAASHGCLRMDPQDAAQVARWLMEHGGQPRGENWFRRILRFRTREEVIYLDNPIRLTISE